MSARRQARARGDFALDASGGVPRALAIGRCIEVWSDLDEPVTPRAIPTIARTKRRFDEVRRWWLHMAGIGDKDGWQIIPGGACWSVDYLTATGRERDAIASLSRAGCTLTQLDDLRAEAEILHERATSAGYAQGPPMDAK